MTDAPAKPEPQPGIACPACGCGHFEVIKITKAMGYLRRRRECRHCGKRITTSERIVGK